MSHGKAKLTKTGPGLKATADKMLRDVGHGQRAVVGILGSTSHRGDGPLDNVALGLVHEFGAPPRVPERSFLRRAFDHQKGKWGDLVAKLLKSKKHGPLPVARVLAILGERMKADVKLGITAGAGIPPPNAPSTVAAKGSDRPLVDTGRLVGSIDYEVRGAK